MDYKKFIQKSALTLICANNLKKEDLFSSNPILIIDIDENNKKAIIQELKNFYLNKEKITLINIVEEEIKLAKLTSDYEFKAIYIKSNTKKQIYTFDDLLMIIRRLRGENGCPWDQKQTHESLKMALVEETYEVLDAIDKKEDENLAEELGDLLLHIVFHAQIAKEENRFYIEEILNAICKKMIHRHPHVFEEEEYDEENFLKRWEDLKQEEKGEKTQTQGLLRIPQHLPALMKAKKVQQKASNVGFDWDEIGPVFKKIEEEYKEVVDAYRLDDIQYIKEELGDLLFSIVNLSRFLDIDSEEALNDATEKFIRRFSNIEKKAIQGGKDMKNMTLIELDQLWDQVKMEESQL